MVNPVSSMILLKVDNLTDFIPPGLQAVVEPYGGTSLTLSEPCGFAMNTLLVMSQERLLSWL